MMMNDRTIRAALAFGLMAGLSGHATAGELVVDSAIEVASAMPILQSATDAANQTDLAKRLRLRGGDINASGTYGDLGLQQTAMEINGTNQIVGTDVPLALSF